MNKLVYVCFIFFAFVTISCVEYSESDDITNNSKPDNPFDNELNNSDSSQSNVSDDSLSDQQPDNGLNNNSNQGKARNKSGSRIIFNEYHLSDGSIIYDDTPFDTSYNRYCSFVRGSSTFYSGLEGCCVSFNSVSHVITAYNDSNCTDEVSLAKVNSIEYNVDNDISAITIYKTSTSTCNTYTTMFIQIEEHINHIVYVKTSSGNCVTWEEYSNDYEKECYYLASYKELTVDEVRSFFVCAD